MRVPAVPGIFAEMADGSTAEIRAASAADAETVRANAVMSPETLARVAVAAA